MCNCRGECCVCANAGGCLAGHGDDYFASATKEKVIENLNSNKYPNYREYMIKYLKEKHGFDYIQSKESEDKSMLHNVTITKTEEKELEEYYVMRGIKKQYDGLGSEKKVVCCEREVSQYPDFGTIAQFLSDTGADFVSVEHNYRFEPDLPFC